MYKRLLHLRAYNLMSQWTWAHVWKAQAYNTAHMAHSRAKSGEIFQSFKMRKSSKQAGSLPPGTKEWIWQKKGTPILTHSYFSRMMVTDSILLFFKSVNTEEIDISRDKIKQKKIHLFLLCVVAVSIVHFIALSFLQILQLFIMIKCSCKAHE